MGFFNESQNILLQLLKAFAVVLLIGHIIGAITILFLRIFFIRQKGNYEIDSTLSYNQIEKHILNDASKLEEHEKLYAFVAFDHGFLPESIHRWVQRRWITFHTSANIATAIFLSFILGIGFGGINITWCWTLICMFFFILFALHARKARKETIEMVMFYTKVKVPENTIQ